MARLLQRSNQPSTNTSSWGGLLSCCFASKNQSPPPPEIPSVKIQPPPSTPAGSVFERDVADGRSVASHGADPKSLKNGDGLLTASGDVNKIPSKQKGSVRRRASSHDEDKPDRRAMAEDDSKRINTEAMYNSWTGRTEPKGSEAHHEGVTLSALASRRSGAQTPTTPGTPPGKQSTAPMDEFAEEHYSKGHHWQSQSSLVHSSAGHYASRKIALTSAFLH